MSKKFVDMYYNILNNSHELMYRFYRTGSTVTVSEALENGATVMESADNEEDIRELVKSVFADVAVTLETTVPQYAMEGSLLILASGTIQRKDHGRHRMFSQAFLLAPQEHGYYVRTDSMQIRGHSSCPILKKAAQGVDGQAAAPQADGQDAQRMVPRTPRNQLGPGMVPAPIHPQPPPPLPTDLMESKNVPEGSAHTRVPSLELQTHTPPVHEAQIEATRSPRVHSSSERQSYPQGALTQSAGPLSHVPPVQTRMMANSRSTITGASQLGRGQQPGTARSVGGAPIGLNQAGPGVPHRRRTTSDPRLLHPMPGHGVFIARLPFGTEATEVCEVMGAFGSVVGGVDGVQVRDGRNGCYAFVNFETLDAAEGAIRGPVKFGGKQVFVERKYSTGDGSGAQTGNPAPVPAAGRGMGRGRPGPRVPPERRPSQ